MRKQILKPASLVEAHRTGDWLDLERIAEVEITSEHSEYPIESAFVPGGGKGWRAEEPGRQRIRLIFDQPQEIRKIHLRFDEPSVERTQQYVLRWSPDGGKSFSEITRQQWNFSPSGSTSETEDHRVQLPSVTILELEITPSIGGGGYASLAEALIA